MVGITTEFSSRIILGIYTYFAKNNNYLKRLMLEFKRFLATHGVQPPLSKNSEISTRYWTIQRTKDPHGPDKYLEADITTEELFKEVLPYLKLDSPILEVGCNIGRNLNYLLEEGYSNLTGIELNPFAINMMQEKFPSLYKTGEFFIGNAMDILPKLPEKSYDLVFTNGVLVNIGPKYNSVFSGMARVSRKYITTYENEDSFNAYPRNWQKMFEKHCFKMTVYKLFKNNHQMPCPYIDKERYGMNVLRVFVRAS